jgi:hypothetical protein
MGQPEEIAAAVVWLCSDEAAFTIGHTHPPGQTIFVTEGWGYASARAVRSRSSILVTACSLSQRRTIGTARPRAGSWSTSRCSRTTSLAAPSHGAGTSPMRSTAPRRRAPTDERRCRFPWGQQQRHLGGVSQAERLTNITCDHSGRPTSSWSPVRHGIRFRPTSWSGPPAFRVPRSSELTRWVPELMVTTRGCPAQIDNAEGVAVRVAENHEVRVRGIQIPGKPACPESDEPLDLGFLLGRGVHEQVEVHARMGLDRRGATLQAQCPPGPVRVTQRPPVFAVPIVGNHEAERCCPKGNGAGQVDHPNHREPESEHNLEARTQRTQTPSALAPPPDHPQGIPNGHPPNPRRQRVPCSRLSARMTWGY